MKRALLLILLVSVIIIGLLPKSSARCGKAATPSPIMYNWFSGFNGITEFFDTGITSITNSKKTTETAADKMKFANNAEHKVMDAPLTAAVSTLTFTVREPNDALDSIEKHLADKMPCSKSCCGAQWPVPHMLHSNDTAEMSADNTYVPNDMSCGNGNTGNGCVCMTTESSNFIASRGSNANNN